MSVFVEKEKLFYEIYEETVKHAGADSGLFVECASINNYHPCCNGLDGVENILNKYNATAKWKLFLENENLNCLMDDSTQALTAIAIAVAIKVFLCPDVDISFSFYVERYDERRIEYWWAISPSAPKGVGLYSKAQVECYLEHLKTGKEYLAEDNQVVVVNGVVKEYRGNDSEVIIPNTAKEIGEKAFEYRQISSVIIPDSVEKIGDYAFSHSGITKIDIPDSVKTIGKGAFYLCKKLNSVKLPVDLNIMDDYLFCGCIELSSIELPEGVTKIGESAFECCSKLESIALPCSLNEIGKTAFKDCKTLKTIAVNANLTKLVGGTFGEIFYHCFALSRVIPQEGIKTYKGSPLEKIWECIHSDYTEGADVNILVSWLGEYFHIVKDDENAFKKIKTSKKQIIDICVYNDNAPALINLLSLFKPLKLNEITDLIDLANKQKSFDVADSLRVYGEGLYTKEKMNKKKSPKDSGSKKMTLAEWRKMFSFETKGDTATITGYKGTDLEVVIPENFGKYAVVSIENDAFSPYSATLLEKQSRENIKSVFIPNGVKNIGIRAFASCKSLTSITIPDSVERICLGAFDSCDKIETITIHDSVTSIGKYAFWSTSYYNDLSNWEDDVLYIGNHLIEAKTSLSGSYIIKDGTKTIADDAFFECTGLTSFIIPDSVTSIGESAFYDTGYYNDSSNWENGVLYIGNNLIKSENMLNGDYIVKTKTKIIASRAFENCANLSTITLPGSVTSIGDAAFFYCSSLVSINIPDSITHIGVYAFLNCKSLTSIVIPDTVTRIGYGAFLGCPNLTIHAPAGSYAEQYAKEKDIKFIAE